MSTYENPRVFTPRGQRVYIPQHACERFIERVCPSVETVEEARDLIREAIHAGRWTTRVPKWAAKPDHRGRRSLRLAPWTVGFFVFEDIVFPVRFRGGCCEVATVITRAMAGVAGP